MAPKKLPLSKIKKSARNYRKNPKSRAKKNAAQPCIIAVPSILIVAPSGMEKDANDFLTPYLFSTIFIVYGIEALLLEVLNVNMINSFNLL